MKKILISLFLITSFLLAQSGVVKVTLKNGTTITGNLVTMNPTGNLVLQVGGQELPIAMSEVTSIDDYQAGIGNAKEDKNDKQDSGTLQYGNYEILDHASYPDSIIVTVGGQELTMILVRGGWFNMGFDGRHSLSMKSEPVHKVNLSSFYISKQYLTKASINNLLGKTDKKGSLTFKAVSKWEDVQRIFNAIGGSYRLPTEAEWEYSAITPVADIIFVDQKNLNEWCSDLFGEYPAQEQTNPKGFKEGNKHVVRSFSRDNNKWKRYKGSDYYNFPFIRIAINADKINN
jgi:small nuclear ribonucleoprotein (snRNP)-like protein